MLNLKQLVSAFTLVLLAVPSALAQNIEITPAEARTSARGPATAYTGVGITEILFLNNEKSELTGAFITFEPGSRTSWHNHPAGQYLIVTAGIGWVQEQGSAKRAIKAGDVVWTPPGVFHWHGASATHALSHYAVWQFVDDSGGEMLGLVSDEEYLAEPAAE